MTLRLADKIDIFKSYDDSVLGPFFYDGTYYREINDGEPIEFHIKKTFNMSTHLEFLEINDELDELAAFKLLMFRTLCDSDGELVLPAKYGTFSEFLELPMHTFIIALFTRHLREIFKPAFGALSVEIEIDKEYSDSEIGPIDVKISNRDAYGRTVSRIDAFCDKYKCMPDQLLQSNPINYCVFLEGDKYREAYSEEHHRKRKVIIADKSSDAQADAILAAIQKGK